MFIIIHLQKHLNLHHTYLVQLFLSKINNKIILFTVTQKIAKTA
jgi:hypothetical protein